MEKSLATFFSDPRHAKQGSELPVSSALGELNRSESDLLQEDFDKNKSGDKKNALLATKEMEERSLDKFLVKYQNDLPTGAIGLNIANKIFGLYSKKTKHSVITRSEATQHSIQCTSLAPNQTWPVISACDLKVANILAKSALIFKSGQEFSTGTTKRPRVDPHTLLQPVSRLSMANKVVFVQYTSRFFIGCNSIRSENENEAITANGLNVANNHFDLSPFCQLTNQQPCKYHIAIFYNQTEHSFHLISYGNSKVRIIGKDGKNVSVLDRPSPIQDGDILEVANVHLTFEVL